jgi:hypothetical protein
MEALWLQWRFPVTKTHLYNGLQVIFTEHCILEINKQTNNKRVRFLQILLVEEAVKIAYLRNSVAKPIEWRQLQWVHRGLGHCPIRNIGIQCFILLGLMTIKS